jgi:hypothetical protein
MHEIEQQPEILLAQGLSQAEIEVRLAIAEYFIRRTAGTPAARDAFDALVRKFAGRYPHHKVCTQLLIAPEYLQAEPSIDDCCTDIPARKK